IIALPIQVCIADPHADHSQWKRHRLIRYLPPIARGSKRRVAARYPAELPERGNARPTLADRPSRLPSDRSACPDPRPCPQTIPTGPSDGTSLHHRRPSLQPESPYQSVPQLPEARPDAETGPYLILKSDEPRCRY